MRLFILFLLLPITAASQHDPRHKMATRCAKPLRSVKLEPRLAEASGLVLWDGRLWTHNDSGLSPTIFAIDTATHKIAASYELPVPNKDWEEIAQDSLYLYIGDTGNNFNRRDTLSIYRIEKQSLSNGRPVVDSITFQWPAEQRNGNRKRRNYNCEAFIATADSIYLFTKERKRTAVYSIPKTVGFHQARFRESLRTNVHITGASFDAAQKRLVLCGYNKFLQTYVLDFPNVSESAFFASKATRYRLRKHFRQTEGIALTGDSCYLINERFRQPWLVDKKQELHRVRL